MNKYVITFGSGQLYDFNVIPNDVMLVIEADNMNEAREKVFDFDGIGGNFCTSYNYDEFVEEFKYEYGMIEYSLSDLNKLRR